MHGGKMLDIGCGNHSPTMTKNINSKIYYVGVDIDKYNINAADLVASDEIYFFDKDVFFGKINAEIGHQFNYMVCAHVIEHLPNKDLLFQTIKKKLVSGGKCFITTPNINSVNFPSSRFTLNYFDDVTHVEMPVTFQQVYDLCLKNNLRICMFHLRNRSVISYLLGLIVEPFRMLLKRNLPFTWSYWGFEDLYIIENAVA